MISREKTAYLKGIAIAAVMVNHYAIFYFDSPDSYANSLIALFFLLSGAGIAYSWDQDRRVRGWRGALGFFLYKRTGRIFPLYWLAYGVILLELAWLKQLPEFTGAAFVTALVGAPTSPRGIFWFVTAILQCYLVAPLLLWLKDRLGARRCLGVAAIAAAALIPLTSLMDELMTNRLAFDMLIYKNLLLGNVLLFFLGMLLPGFVTAMRRSFDSRFALPGAALIFAVLIYAGDAPGFLQRELAPLLFAATFLFCLVFAAADIKLPAARPLKLLGDNSYPLYLFHQAFLIGLSALGVIAAGSYLSVLYTLALFPPFLWACVMLQRLQRRLIRRSGARRTSDDPVEAAPALNELG